MLNKLIWAVLFATTATNAAVNGAAALKIAASARGSAMGEAFTAVADDASALFWNPAGAVALENRGIQLSYASWIQGISNQTLSLIAPTRYGAFGFGIMLTTVEGFEQRIIASEEPLGVFSANSLIAAATYARRVLPNWTFGANLKFMHEKIYIENSQGWMVDFGLQWRAPLEGLRLAAALQNWGTTTRMAQERVQLPRTLRFGAAYRLPRSAPEATVAFDYVTVRGETAHLQAGAEIAPLPYLLLRTGYQTGFEDKGISFGFGLRLQRAAIDYAYVPFGRGLGDTHRFSVSLPF
ncbi:MAG: PorV/PorQ family protein [candidate division KSB1 bacterium]|nr:PorV/PorQ family protein [candidate division KSB1 bacterium]MDZ7346432.1 PorV/PorQ family protein [candidate division KSB1 bacterium]